MAVKTLFGYVRSTTCSICGRELTDPVSVQRGVGPVCWVEQSWNESQTAPDSEFIDEPLVNGVICQREKHGIKTNVPQLIKHHSPSGFEWGYGGSGPADLALNICEIALKQLGHNGPRMACHSGRCFEAAWAMHQDFKFIFVATMPRCGGEIAWDTVLKWVGRNVPEYIIENVIV